MQRDYILKYQGSKADAKRLDAFYTPPSLGKQMVDKLTSSIVGKTCLDNCCGYGGLVLQMLDKKVEQGEDAAQALSEVYGIEFDKKNLEICIRNLRIWADKNHATWNEDMIRSHFRQGDALQDESYEFPDKRWGLYKHVEIEDLEDKYVIRTIVDSKVLKKLELSKKAQKEKMRELLIKLKKKKVKVVRT